jgi:hypothetical protein
MADEDAYIIALDEIFENKMNATKSWDKLPTPIEIQTYNVQPYQTKWTDIIESHMATIAAKYQKVIIQAYYWCIFPPICC